MSNPVYTSGERTLTLYRIATVGPVVSAPRISSRRLGVCLSSMRQFIRYHTGKCQAIGLRPSHSSFNSSLETQTEKSGTFVTAKSPTVNCPMLRPQRYSNLQKPISGYQPRVGSERTALINVATRTLGNDCVQEIVVRLITT